MITDQSTNFRSERVPHAFRWSFSPLPSSSFAADGEWFVALPLICQLLPRRAITLAARDHPDNSRNQGVELRTSVVKFGGIKRLNFSKVLRGKVNPKIVGADHLRQILSANFR
jgi:hypothetical protein